MINPLNQSPTRIAGGCCASFLLLALGWATAADMRQEAARHPRPHAMEARETFQGTVMMIEDNHITLDADGARMRFFVPPGTMIVVNSAESDLADVVPGYYASITATNAGRDFVASFIDATRQYHPIATLGARVAN